MSHETTQTMPTLDLEPGDYDVILEADCSASQSSDCDPMYFKDFDGVSISVIEDQPPEISSPGDITVLAPPDRIGAQVKYDISVADDCSIPTMTCSIPPGSLFRMGVTPVQCTAEDSAGKTETVAFDVTVKVDDSIHWTTGKVKGGAISWPALMLLTALLILRYSRRQSWSPKL